MVDIYNQFRDFKSIEVVFRDSSTLLQRILCSVRSIENNSIILYAKHAKNNNIVANVGTDIQLHIYTENGIYSSDSKVLLADKGLLGTEYVITYPAHSKHSQRREYFRAEIPVKFKMHIYTDDNFQESIPLDAVTKNICGKGMCFVSNKPFPTYSLLELELYFSEKAIKTSAELVYTKAITINDKQRFIHAFTFTDIENKNIEFIIKKCFLYQLDLRKRV